MSKTSFQAIIVSSSVGRLFPFYERTKGSLSLRNKALSCYYLCVERTGGVRRTVVRLQKNKALLGPLLGSALVLAGCADGSNVLQPAGEGAAIIANLWWVIFWMAVGVGVVVEGLIVFAMIRFRHKPNDPLPAQIEGNTRIEVAWTLVPAVVLAVVAFATLSTMQVIAAPNPQAMQVNVIGHQWWWEFRYQDGKIITSDELHIPVNQPVELHVTSADVLHNFWMPELDRKVQALPGHDNIIPLTPTKIGTYLGFCAEFCGMEHAMMRFDVVVESQADFNTWIAAQALGPATPQTAAELAGQKDFQSIGCSICHTIGTPEAKGMPNQAGMIVVGPNLTHVGSRQVIVGGAVQNTTANMEHWLRAPNDVKPGNYMTTMITNGMVSAQQAQDLAAYLASLK